MLQKWLHNWKKKHIINVIDINTYAGFIIIKFVNCIVHAVKLLEKHHHKRVNGLWKHSLDSLLSPLKLIVVKTSECCSSFDVDQKMACSHWQLNSDSLHWNVCFSRLIKGERKRSQFDCWDGFSSVVNHSWVKKI